MSGDARQAFTRLAEAEKALGKADERREAIGGYDRCAFLFHVGRVREHTGDLPGSITALEASIRVQPPRERQGRLHAHATPAHRRLRAGHPEAACSDWGRFLDHYGEVSTTRGDDHLRTMVRTPGPHRKHSTVRDLLARAREVATAKA